MWAFVAPGHNGYSLFFSLLPFWVQGEALPKSFCCGQAYNGVMFAPDVEARFKKIDDAHAATAKLQRLAKLRAKEHIDLLRAIQNAMARWQKGMAEKERFLKPRTNGADGGSA